MLRGCRFIILAIAGLISVGAAKVPQPPAEAEKQQSQAKEANASPDAASDAAKWAWWQLWLSGLGVLGLGITLWFNYRALDRAKEANTIAKDTAFKQLRAYVTIERATKNDDLVYVKEDAFQGVKIMLHNSGATPAVGVSVRAKTNIISENKPRQIDEKVEVSDIGAQARQAVNLPWFHATDFIRGNHPIPKTIEGRVSYITAIPDACGQPSRFDFDFCFEPSSGDRREVTEISVVKMPQNYNF